MKQRTTLLILAFTLIIPLIGFSQCKNFAKKDCMPKLSPYMHNGQLNSASLVEGETAELILTLYAGQNYRIMVCAQEVFPTVQFKLFDIEKKVVFDSKDANYPKFWDFNVGSTERFTLEVIVPKSESPNELVKNGCVSVLVGFKQ